MEDEKETPELSKFSAIFAPLVISIALIGLAIFTSTLDGRGLDQDFFTGIMLISISATIPACLARVSGMIPLDSGALRIASFTTTMLVLGILANLADPDNFNHLFVSTLVLVGLVSSLLNESERLEESSMFLSTILGMRLAAFYAGGLEIAQNDSMAAIDLSREAIGSAFFSFWLSSISLGFVVMVCLRGSLEKRGKGRLMSSMPTLKDNYEVGFYSSLIFVSFATPLIWLGQIETLQDFSQGSHVGLIWASFSALVIFLHAFFRAEGWHVLGSLLVVNWLLYSIGHIHEIGNELPSLFSEDGFIGSFTWFFLWFWLNFFALFFTSRGVFGDVAPRRERSGFRVWWQENSYFAMVSLAFLVALIVRTAWNVIPAMNANGTGLWDMTGGSDPWYMKRVVDYVIAERSHLIFDHDRAYPTGGINPRPPLFSWSLALGGIAISWILEIPTDQAVWWSMAALPAIYGALIVLPIAGIASRAHDKRSGIIAAWLIALMPGHMSRSTFAMVDHDSFAMLFLAIAFYYWIRAIERIDHQKLFKTTSANPLYIVAGMRETWKRNPSLMANATMSGIAFSIMALGWKGFVYGPGILFLAYSFQVAINIFKGRDSLQFTSAALQMMLVSILIPAPFYAWPGMNLLFAPSGMQPMFYIIGFTFAMGWVSSSFRDKPWLLVVLGGSVLFGSILAILFILQQAEFYNGWDILFTGGFYFSKNKIFGTIGEAQAPERGVLFASYGPIVALIALGCAFLLLWRGSRKNKSGLTLLGLWTIIASYMAWTAGRFIINATPAMAAVGGIGISMLWGAASLPAFNKVWRNSGIGTPRSRFRSLWPATKARPGVPAMIIVLLLVTSQHATYGIDAGIPRGEQSANDIDQSMYDIVPDILRQDLLGLFSIMNGEQYDQADSGLWYMGTFGPSFNSQGWNEAYNWLSNQDSEISFSDRPAFVSWWDYGFQALASGQHPTVADNFQSGIPNSGAMLLSGGQEDTLALFIATLAVGDRSLNSGLGEDFLSALGKEMSDAQIQEFQGITSNNDRNFLEDRSMAVVANYGDAELLLGNPLGSDGIPVESRVYIVMVNGEQFGDVTSNESDALSLFDEARGSSSEYVLSEFDDASHYDLAGYRYTRDIMDDYYDVSTALHRTNARFGMARAFLTTAFQLEELVNIYDGISSIDSYQVSDYEESHGSTTSRNHEIRYFAVDNRLFPLGGKYYQDYQSYHRGQTTGIFHAPTHLSGLDIDSYITTTYETNQGPMSAEDFQEQYLDDLKAQASGASTGEDMIQMTDMDYQHLDAFFDTMIARTYVGYGTSTLGLPSISGQVGDADTPSTWILPNSLTGTPGSYLQGAMALPGAMMNHFVLSNWYDPTNGSYCEEIEISGTASAVGGSTELTNVTLTSSGLSPGWSQIQSGGPWEMTSVEDGVIPFGVTTGQYDSDSMTLSISSGAISSSQDTHFTLTGKGDKYCGSIYDSNRNVKILKYYSGATLEGTVSLEGVGTVPNARILIERDAFSGEDNTDNDSRTYWIPIGSTQADDDGKYSFTVPAGKIRVSAFIGDPDLESARTMLMSGSANAMSELFTEDSKNRVVNPVTGILGNVYGSTWLSDAVVNISGQDGHSNGKSIINVPISVTPSTASGILSWSGEQDFDEEPIPSVQITLSPTSEEVNIPPYVTTTSNGSMEGIDLSFTGAGEVTFLGEGKLESIGSVSVRDFTGTHTQEIFDNHSITGSGTFSGIGLIEGTIIGDYPDCSDNSVPDGSEACINEEGNYLLDGEVNASGKFTSTGISEFTRELSQSTFIGSGTFVTNTTNELSSFGTINGTGTFSGHGIFSGPMVRAGSFHIVDALPGEYTVSVDFGTGDSVELSQTFVIPLKSSDAQTPVSVSGGAIKGVVSLYSGEPLATNVAIFSINGSSADAIIECEGTISQPCYTIPDESGSFEIGPIVPGEYIAEIDVDDDGYAEVSQIFNFDQGEPSLLQFPSEVPRTSDITFTLSDAGSMVNNLELSFTSENLSRNSVSVVFDNDSETYYAELLAGEWILNYSLSDEKQLWQRVAVGSEDITESFEFKISQEVNGIVLDKPDKNGLSSANSRVANQEILFQWDGFSVKTTTDSFGHFSVILPQGAFVQATVERMVGAGGLFSNGTSLEVTEGMGNITIELADATMVLGEVSLNREGNTYNRGFSGWHPVYAQAVNSDGTTSAVWREEVDELGRFDMLLPNGNWTFVLDAGDNMGSSTVERELNSSIDSMVELLVLPLQNTTVRIDFFIDHEGDNNVSNGTPVTYPFEIKPLTPNGEGVSISADGIEWIQQGLAEISLEPGKYRIVVERANSSADEPFDTLYDTNEIFDVGIDSQTVERSVGFEPRWLVNVTLRNESGENLSNHLVKLENIESGWVQSFLTNDEGMLVEYISEGEWIVIVDEFETNSGVYEGLRRVISVSSESAGSRLNFQTAELATVTVNLESTSDVASLEMIDLTVTSQDGLGDFTVEIGGFSQSLELRLVPGMWSVEANQTNQEGVRMLLEDTPLVESGVTVGPSHQVVLTVQKLVSLSGKVFWDLNGDGSPNFSEGLANATVSVSGDSEEEDIEMLTSQDGTWSTFLPVQSSWNVTVEKPGFSAQQEIQVLVGEIPVNQDIEISAGQVEVSGIVSYLDSNCISSGEWQLELIPSHGIARDRVIVTGNSLGEWSTSIQPGSWVAKATSTSDESSEECQNLVSLDALEVGVEGGSVDSELMVGGMMRLDTSWIDLEGNVLDLNEVDDYDLKIEYGGLSWSEKLGEDGILNLLMLSGNIQTSSSFEIDESGRNVSYSGGKGVTIRADQITPIITLDIDRDSKQDIIASITGSDRVAVQEVDQTCTNDNDGDGVINGEDAFPDDPSETSDNDGDGLGDNADPDDDNDGDEDSMDEFPLGQGLSTNTVEGCKYEAAYFTITVDYDGHNTFDEYTVVGTVPGADGVDWTVEFKNSTGEWLDSVDFNLGLSGSDLVEEIEVRVIPANVGVAHHFQDGHIVLVKISTSQGYSNQVELMVDIPESDDLEINHSENVFFTEEENAISLEIPFRNNGNSDEIFNFQFEPSDWWEFAGPMTQPASPFSDGKATFTLIRSSETGLPSPYAEELTFTITDQDNNTYSGTTLIQMDSPDLSIVEDSATLLGGKNAAFGQIETYSIGISNDGNVDAERVTLIATLCSDIRCNNPVGVNSTSVGEVPAMGESTFTISMDYTQFNEAKKYYIVFHIEGEELGETAQDCGSSQSSGEASCVFEAQLWTSSEENENLKYLAYAFLIMLIGALLYFTKRPGRRVSAPF